jgi:hypothetical protein
MLQDNITVIVQENIEIVNIAVENITENVIVNVTEEPKSIEISVSELGEPGLTGKSVYEIAVDNGFVGTEAEWLQDFTNNIIDSVLNSISKQDWYTNNQLAIFMYSQQKAIKDLQKALSLSK